MSCKKICKMFAVKKPVSGSRYGAGQGHCQICDVWIDYRGAHMHGGIPASADGIGWFCNCCNYRVRQMPRNKIYKEKIRKQQQEILLNKRDKPPSSLVVEEHLEIVNAQITKALDVIKSNPDGAYVSDIQNKLNISKDQMSMLIPRLSRMDDISTKELGRDDDTIETFFEYSQDAEK